MGFLKDWNAGISDIESSMDGLVRKKPRDIKFIGPSVVWVVFYTEEEVAEFLQYASGLNKSMFLVSKRTDGGDSGDSQPPLVKPGSDSEAARPERRNFFSPWRLCGFHIIGGSCYD